jgi:hypothetical protein
MEPNDLPIVCLPLQLTGEDAAALIDFLYALAEALDRHYGAQLINRLHHLEPTPPPEPASTSTDDPPF